MFPYEHLLPPRVAGQWGITVVLPPQRSPGGAHRERRVLGLLSWTLRVLPDNHMLEKRSPRPLTKGSGYSWTASVLWLFVVRIGESVVQKTQVSVLEFTA